MNETLLPLLEQAITVLNTMEVCFLKYVFFKTETFGKNWRLDCFGTVDLR